MNWAPPVATNLAADVDHVTLALLVLSSLLVAAVWFLIIFFCIKYRRGRKANRENPPLKAPAWELGLSGLIFVFGLGTFVWSTVIFAKMVHPPSESREVYLIAKRWMWIFRDPQHGDQINVLRVPLGTAVLLVMTSEDVIHSFYVPAFRLKQDILPGRYTQVWFQANQLGQFPILCAQFCGTGHSEMRGMIEVVPPATETLVSADPLRSKGAQLFAEKGCVTCHAGPHAVAPSLGGLFGTKVALEEGASAVVDETYLRNSILNPALQVVKGYQPVMPTYQGQLSEADLLALIHYLRELKSNGGTP